MELIVSFVPTESRRRLARVSKQWYASAFTWAYQDIFLRDDVGFREAVRFWEGLSSSKASNFKGIGRWKAATIGHHRMLRTPRSATLGSYVEERKHKSTTQPGCADVAFLDGLGTVFGFLSMFPRLTSLHIRIAPFPITELLALLGSVPGLQALKIDAGCISSSPEPEARHSLTPSLLPQALRHISLVGAHLAALTPAQWDTVLLLVTLPNLEELQLDVTTWNALHVAWRSRLSEGGSCILESWYWQQGRNAVSLKGVQSLDNFVLLASTCGRIPQHDYSLSALGEYLSSSRDTLRSITTPASEGSGTSSHYHWGSFKNLAHYQGGVGDFLDISSAKMSCWQSVNFVRVGGFDVVGRGLLADLTTLAITLSHEREIGFVMGSCPCLSKLHVKLLTRDLTAL
ncbi:hypothetical protein PM082_023427 [Marasmius tenuissimus]|nr:hypothetical protein PM082_023427 [Marasmius tenuissimus]